MKENLAYKRTDDTEPETKPPETGGEVLNIAEYLKHQPKAADLLLAEYAQLVKKAEQAAEEIGQLYNEIFFNKQADKKEITGAILKQANRLLVEAEEKLKDTPENDKPAIIEELKEELIREQMAQERMLEDFKAMALNLNKQYAGIYKEYDDIRHESFKSDVMAKEFPKGGNTEEMEDYEDYLDMTREMKYHPATAWSVNEAHEMAVEKERIDKKFDSVRIEKILDEMYGLAEELEQNIGKNGVLYGYDAETIYDFIDKLKALLALQEAVEKKIDQVVYGEKQIKNENGLEQSSPEAILNKYQELVDLTTKNKKELAGLFKNQIKITPADLSQITENVLAKAKECLDNFDELIQKGGEVGKAEILKNLEKYKTDLILTASVFKILAERGDVKLEDIKGITFEQTTAAEMVVSPRVISAVENEINASKNLAIPASAFKGAITAMIKDLNSEESRKVDEIVQMIYIYGENYKHKPEFSDKLLTGFIGKLKTGGDKVRIYKALKDRQLMAFYRFDDKDDGDKYFGSFNVNPVMQGSKIGTALMTESLKKEGAGCDIEADTDPETLISSKYIEDEGFVATEVLKNYGGSDDMVFSIHRREDNKRYYYRDRDYKSADIVKQYEKDFGGLNTERPESKVIYKFSSPKEMLAAIEPLVNGGYTVSRYFYEDARKSQAVYCALERSFN